MLSATLESVLNRLSGMVYPESYLCTTAPFFCLPYYFGVGRSKELNHYLIDANCYLIFRNVEDNGRVSVLLLDCDGEVHTVAINGDAGGYWFIPEDRTFNFTLICALIDHYQRNEKPLLLYSRKRVQTVKYVILEHFTLNPDHLNELSIENCGSIYDCSYYNVGLSLDRIGERLINDGDYLVNKNFDQDSPICVHVRWNGAVKAFQVPLVSERGMYSLFTCKRPAVVEYVSNLDELLKSVSRCRLELNGTVLKKPVQHYDKKLVNVMSGDCFENEISSSKAMLKCQSHFSNEKPFSVLSYRSPCPVDCLPYYHGLQVCENLHVLLENAGDFLLFHSATDSQLKIIVRCFNNDDSSCFSIPIIYHRVKEVFYLKQRDCECHFTTVEELIEYYRVYQLSIDAHSWYKPTTKSTCRPIVKLVKPIYNWLETFKSNLTPTTSENHLQYFYDDAEMQHAVDQLEESGDFFLRENNIECLMVIVLWNNAILEIPLEQDKRFSGYILPTFQKDEPKESTQSVDQYIKLVMRSQASFNGVILRRPLLK